MSPVSRRRALRAVTTCVTIGLAGCSESPKAEYETVTHEATEDDTLEPVTDFELKTVRTTKNTWLFRHADEENSDEQGTPYQEQPPEYNHYVHTSLQDQPIEFNDQRSEMETLVEFTKETDFDNRSVILFQRDIPECYDLYLTTLERGETHLNVGFCRKPKSEDVDCEDSPVETQGIAIRLPFSEELEQFTARTNASCHTEGVLLSPNQTDSTH